MLVTMLFAANSVLQPGQPEHHEEVHHMSSGHHGQLDQLQLHVQLNPKLSMPPEMECTFAVVAQLMQAIQAVLRPSHNE